MNQNNMQPPVEYRAATVPKRRGCGCLGLTLIGGLLFLAIVIFGGIIAIGTFVMLIGRSKLRMRLLL
jgi:hypothetical protein